MSFIEQHTLNRLLKHTHTHTQKKFEFITRTEQLQLSPNSICWTLKNKQGMFCWNSMPETNLLRFTFSRFTLF